MKKITPIFFVLFFSLFLAACELKQPPSDQIMSEQQEKLLKEAVSSVGMPAIRNFREKRLLKFIYELRDQEGLITYTYLVALNGSRKFLCKSHGFPINDATGFSSPEKLVNAGNGNYVPVIQAEPNGMFTPDASNSYWVVCLLNDKPSPTFVTGYPLVTTSPL